MTGSWKRSQQMAHVRSSRRLVLVGAEAAAAMAIGAFRSTLGEVKAKA